MLMENTGSQGIAAMPSGPDCMCLPAEMHSVDMGKQNQQDALVWIGYDHSGELKWMVNGHQSGV